MSEPGPDLPAVHRLFEYFSGKDERPHSAHARLIGLFIAKRMRRYDCGTVAAWPSLKTIARDTGLNVTTVRRVLTRELVEGPLPLFAVLPRGTPLVWKGERYSRHKSAVYVFVSDPAAFAAERDRLRAAAPARAPKPPRAYCNLPGRTVPAARVSARSHAPVDVRLSALTASAETLLRRRPKAAPPDPDQEERTRRQIADWRAAREAAPLPEAS